MDGLLPGWVWGAAVMAGVGALVMTPVALLTRGWTRRHRLVAQAVGLAVVIGLGQAVPSLLPASWRGTSQGTAARGADAGLDAASLEAAMFEQMPAFRMVARREPALWRRTLDDAAVVAQTAVASGATPGTGPVAAALQDAFAPLLARLAAVAVGAPDDAVLQWAGAENALNASLMAGDPVQCGRRVQNLGFRTDLLAALDTVLLAAAQDAKVAAYEAGLAAAPPAVVPDAAVGAALVQRALALPGYAMPAEEVQALNDLARAPPELACRAWTHFNRNLLALPRADGAALARFALGPR